MTKGDSVKVTTTVAVEPPEAFDVFTREIDLWWRRGPRYRFGGERRGVLRFEPGLGGRLVEVFDEAGNDVFEVGRVLAWEPAERLAFEWRIRNFAPGERTEVEVRFEPAPGGTLVTVEHRGWAAIPEDHPARHGLTGGAFTDMIGLWWAAIVNELRSHASRSHPR